MNVEDKIKRIKELYLPDSYNIELLPLSDNDIACCWRTFKITKNDTNVKSILCEDTEIDSYYNVYYLIPMLDVLNGKENKQMANALVYCICCDKMVIKGCTLNGCPLLPTRSKISKRQENGEKEFKENSKMTRDEVIKKVTGYHSEPAKFIDALEALGLLKFEPEQSKLSVTSIIKHELENQGPSRNYSVLTDKIINKLLQLRYKIVDTDVFNIVDKRSDGCVGTWTHYRGFSHTQIDNLISQDKSKR